MGMNDIDVSVPKITSSSAETIFQPKLEHKPQHNGLLFAALGVAIGAFVLLLLVVCKLLRGRAHLTEDPIKPQVPGVHHQAEVVGQAEKCEDVELDVAQVDAPEFRGAV